MYSVVFVEYIDFAILEMDLARLDRMPLVSENEGERKKKKEWIFILNYRERGDEEWWIIQYSNFNAKVTGTWINFVDVQKNYQILGGFIKKRRSGVGRINTYIYYYYIQYTYTKYNQTLNAISNNKMGEDNALWMWMLENMNRNA